MALDDSQEKKLKDFLEQTGARVTAFGARRRNSLDDDTLSNAEALLKTGVLQKYVYGQLGIHPQTWFSWSKKGRDMIEKLTKGEEPDLLWNDLSETDQRMVYLTFLIESSKARTVVSTWADMKTMSKGGNYKAAEFILRIVGGKDFMIQEHLVLHGVGQGGDRDTEIEAELAGFRAKTPEDLEVDEKVNRPHTGDEAIKESEANDERNGEESNLLDGGAL